MAARARRWSSWLAMSYRLQADVIPLAASGDWRPPRVIAGSAWKTPTKKARRSARPRDRRAPGAGGVVSAAAHERRQGSDQWFSGSLLTYSPDGLARRDGLAWSLE